jgi:hypothetical protein
MYVDCNTFLILSFYNLLHSSVPLNCILCLFPNSVSEIWASCLVIWKLKILGRGRGGKGSPFYLAKYGMCAPHYSFKEYDNKWLFAVASALFNYTFWESARRKDCYGSRYKPSNWKKKKMVQFKHLQLFFAKYNFIPSPLPACSSGLSDLACQW